MHVNVTDTAKLWTASWSKPDHPTYIKARLKERPFGGEEANYTEVLSTPRALSLVLFLLTLYTSFRQAILLMASITISVLDTSNY